MNEVAMWQTLLRVPMLSPDNPQNTTRPYLAIIVGEIALAR